MPLDREVAARNCGPLHHSPTKSGSRLARRATPVAQRATISDRRGRCRRDRRPSVHVGPLGGRDLDITPASAEARRRNRRTAESGATVRGAWGTLRTSDSGGVVELDTGLDGVLGNPAVPLAERGTRARGAPGANPGTGGHHRRRPGADCSRSHTSVAASANSDSSTLATPSSAITCSPSSIANPRPQRAGGNWRSPSPASPIAASPRPSPRSSRAAHDAAARVRVVGEVAEEAVSDAVTVSRPR